MSIATKIKNILEHPLVDTIANFLKKFKSSKSYWSVSFIVIIFTLREAIAWKYGSAISAYAQKQLTGSDWAWLWTAIEFLFDIGGSWELVLLGVSYFIILSYVKVNSAEKDEIVKVVKDESSKTRDDLDEIKALIKQHGTSETDFLEKYFGKDYAVILQNPQTYHNFTTLLNETKKTADELLKEREELLKKIEKQSFNKKLQNQIDKAFKELRYEDVRDLIDGFLEANADKEKEIIKAHYIKALSFMEQIRYHEAKEEFEKIAPNIDDVEILSDYAKIYYILGEYDKAIAYYEKALTLSHSSESSILIAGIYANKGTILHIKGKYDEALNLYKRAVDIFAKEQDINILELAKIYSNMGVVFKKKEKYDKAIRYFQKALDIELRDEKIPESIITTLNNIGTTLQSNQEYDKAIKFHMKSLKLSLQVYKEDSLDTAVAYNNIGTVFTYTHQFDNARTYFYKALNIVKSTLGETHYNLFYLYQNIAKTWVAEYNYSKAIEYYEKALHILYGVFPNGHPNIDVIEGNLNSAKESLKNEPN